MVDKISGPQLLNAEMGSAPTGCVSVASIGLFDKLVIRGKRNVDGGALAVSCIHEIRDFGGPAFQSQQQIHI